MLTLRRWPDRRTDRESRPTLHTPTTSRHAQLGEDEILEGLGLLVLALVREGDADVREEPLDASKVSSILSLTRAGLRAYEYPCGTPHRHTARNVGGPAPTVSLLLFTDPTVVLLLVFNGNNRKLSKR